MADINIVLTSNGDRPSSITVGGFDLTPHVLHGPITINPDGGEWTVDLRLIGTLEAEVDGVVLAFADGANEQIEAARAIRADMRETTNLLRENNARLEKLEWRLSNAVASGARRRT